MNPADAEADARRAQPVGERERDHLAAARDHDPVHLGAVDELLEDRLAARRGRQRFVQMRVDVVQRLDTEDAALTPRVRRLEHRGEADLVGGASPLRERPHCCEPWLRHAGVREAPPHRDLVRHQMRGLCADARQSPRLGDLCHDGHRAVGADGEHTVELESRRRLQHCGDVGEVDDLRDVRFAQARCVRVAVDGRDAQALSLRLQDRPALVPAGADEEDGSHASMMLVRRERRPQQLQRPLEDRAAGDADLPLQHWHRRRRVPLPRERAARPPTY